MINKEENDFVLGEISNLSANFVHTFFLSQNDSYVPHPLKYVYSHDLLRIGQVVLDKSFLGPFF